MLVVTPGRMGDGILNSGKEFLRDVRHNHPEEPKATMRSYPEKKGKLRPPIIYLVKLYRFCWRPTSYETCLMRFF